MTAVPKPTKTIPVVKLFDKDSDGSFEVFRLDIQGHAEKFFSNLRRNVEKGEHKIEVAEITVKEWNIIELNGLADAGEIDHDEWEKQMFKLTGKKPGAAG